MVTVCRDHDYGTLLSASFANFWKCDELLRIYSIASTPSRSPRSNNNSLLVTRVKTNTGARAFHSCVSLQQPVAVCPFSHFSYYLLRNIWKHISLTWPFLHSYCHSPWPVDVMEQLDRIRCWTLIRLSHHWAWLHRGYGAIEVWLIDWYVARSQLRALIFAGLWTPINQSIKLL